MSRHQRTEGQENRIVTGIMTGEEWYRNGDAENKMAHNRKDAAMTRLTRKEHGALHELAWRTASMGAFAA